MKIAFVGHDRWEVGELVHELIFSGLRRFMPHPDPASASLKNPWKTVTLGYGMVLKHWLTRSYVSGITIYEAWATGRLIKNPWYRRRLFSWGLKHIEYDFIFYIPPKRNAELGEIEKAIDENTVQLMNAYRIPYHVLKGTRKNKIATIIETIGE